MSERIGELVKELARIHSIDLAPDWIDRATGDTGEDRDAITRLCTSLGWDQPQPVRGKPRAHAFPMLVHSPTAGWWIAEQWETGDSFRVRGLGQEAVRSDEHTSELQSLMRISYAVFCLKNKKT